MDPIINPAVDPATSAAPRPRFWQLSALFASSLLVGFSGAIMPGPLFAAVIAQTAASGVWAGPAMVLGHGLLELAVVLALAMGVGATLTRPIVTRAIAGAGGAALLWLAYTMISDGLAGRVTLDTSSAGQATGEPVLLGALISLANPYWMFWWATVGAGYVAIALRQGTSGLVAFFWGHILSDLIWYSSVSLIVAQGRRFVGPGVFNGIVVAAGLFLVVLAATFFKLALSRRALAPAPPA